MFAVYVVVTLIAIVANAAEAVLNFRRAESVLKNMAEARVPGAMLPYLGAIKGAGALGLTAGLLGPRPFGIAAAAGLTLFFLCAVAVHLYTRVLHNIYFPLLFLAFAAGSLALGLTQL
ncbi:DoxX family protein [Nocardia sp. NBC_01503]|uniref:DoxX family protein n=1 Tax=Nocardia sp. NBC_01503 TaxID=2975997 RepID=UPI002E7B6DC9|nr:DoxX family protein [Nocardia sp. NBC_01503]WTL35456.1 DoxX family protein [Nocardia sp. NBC_01503]